MSLKASLPRGSSLERKCFEAFLKSRKSKLTSERIIIFDAVFHHPSHFDAESLHTELRKLNISRATVYRTLDLLVQSGLVRKNNLGANHAIYEVAKENEHHDHLICLKCGKVVEFFCSDLEALQMSVSTEHGFQIFHHSLQIFGLCSKCKGRMDEITIRNKVAQLHL